MYALSQQEKRLKAFGHEFTTIIDAYVGPDKLFRNYKALSEKAGMSPSTITYLKQGRIKNPDEETLRRISVTIGRNKDFVLFTGQSLPERFRWKPSQRTNRCGQRRYCPWASKIQADQNQSIKDPLFEWSQLTRLNYVTEDDIYDFVFTNVQGQKNLVATEFLTNQWSQSLTNLILWSLSARSNLKTTSLSFLNIQSYSILSSGNIKATTPKLYY